MILALGAALLALGVVLYVLGPVLTGERAPLHREDDEPSEAEARRRVSLRALRDAEYDFATGKLDANDYARLRRELSVEALEALEREEREAGSPESDEDLEREVRRIREGLRRGTTCTDCGHPNRPGSRFCGACGRPLGAGGLDDPAEG